MSKEDAYTLALEIVSRWLDQGIDGMTLTAFVDDVRGYRDNLDDDEFALVDSFVFSELARLKTGISKELELS